MTRIYKYPLEFKIENRIGAGVFACKIQMPKGAHTLSVDLDPTGVMSLWAKVDHTAPQEERIFYAAFTGVDLPQGIDPAQFIATRQNHAGIVLHIFANREADAAVSAMLNKLGPHER